MKPKYVDFDTQNVYISKFNSKSALHYNEGFETTIKYTSN